MPYGGPQCFAIPGNHDWFDGLQTFMRHICQRSWLGGWLLPQKRSYFALQLPKGWWVFGFDQALHADIDVYQFKFFAELTEDKVGKNDSVIIMTHEPNWLLDWYGNDKSGNNVSHLIRDHLKGRCKLRMAGDLHHYMHHSSVPSDKPVYVQHLLVNGCGGAFLHPTHTFSNFKELYETSYVCEKAYPTFEESRKIPLGNILGFRKRNLGFDIIGGIIYFILVFSMFPQWQHISRAIIGILHVSAHMTAVLILMLSMELGVEMCINQKLVPPSGYHTLYKWFLSERKHVPGAASFLAFINQWTFGLCSACIKYIMFAFDVPEVRLHLISEICHLGTSIHYSYIHAKNFRLWPSPGPESATRRWSHHVEISFFTIVRSSSISGFSQPVWCLWCLEATCISASTVLTYTMMKLFPHSATLITRDSLASTLPMLVILKSSPLQLTRCQRNGNWIQSGRRKDNSRK
ncbi:hypothetical protein NE237_017980 [Protea cynaroides]|uniref:Calcineurin-like phosphoesterase domain-containing protein n=1 Tax=Protea cynaroides TaxID=273540 RepID=A0A9Q0K918_9MAGN|nr:hypothetical protein NE237_017980 [Protea cynaroides]